MAGPWEKFQRTAPASGPWQKYSDQSAERGSALDPLVQGTSLGFSDELAGAFGAGMQALGIPGALGEMSPGEAYTAYRDRARGNLEGYREDHPIASTALEVAGTIPTAMVPVGLGASLGANALRAGHGLGRVAAGTAADGAILGAIQGTGAGEDLESRASGGLLGAAGGGAVGLGAPYLTSAAGAVAKPFIAPFASRLRPDRYANTALGETLRRSGRTPAEIEASLAMALQDAQPVWTMADAMGHAGQRALSTTARTPHDARQEVVDALMGRQAGQGRRIAGALAEGFGAPDTATQRSAALTTARDSAADVAYDAARANAGPVDVTGALARIDETLRPGAWGVMRPASSLADDSIEGVLTKVRNMLGNGREQISDFNAALRAKRDIDDMIGRATRSGASNQARLLIQVRNELDNALAAASQPYAAARDAFRAGSREIEGVEAGRQAARRGRPEDTLAAFGLMTPQEQAAFRAGYADPLIEGVQTAATGTNKARPLINDATAAEFPAFAVPGRAPQLMRRIGREQAMFETNQAALGGSRTADNLADAADMNRFDPGVLANLLRGRPIQAVIEGATKLVNNARGMPPSVVERVARALMESRPDAARALLDSAQSNTQMTAGRRALVNALLVGSGVGLATP